VASNPGQIPAGGKERISVKVNTRNRGGQKLHKGFTVYTNDPQKREVRLQVTGQVNAYLTVAPNYVRFFGRGDRPLRQTVKITPLEGHPFMIKEVKAQQGQNLRYELKPMGSDPGKNGYELVVENTMKEAGNYRDMITIQTDSKEQPLVTIPVYARIQKAPDQGQQKTN
jgi:hypothetical protein